MAVSASSQPSGSFIICIRWLVALVALGVVAQAADWPKIDKAELAETTSKIDPAASAEILARETTMDHFTFAQTDRSSGTTTYGSKGAEDRYYMRVKIFSDEGVQRFSPLKLRYDVSATLQGFAARIIKPDGKMIDVKPEDIRDEVTVTKAGRKVNSRSVTFVSLAPGDIVEYCYSTLTSKSASTAILDFQSDLPTRLVRFKVGLIKHPDPAFTQKRELNKIAYNCSLSGMVQKDGFLILEKKDLPAIKWEPLQPPAYTTAMTLIVYIKTIDDQKPDAYWSKYSKTLHAKLEPWIKEDPKISAALPAIINESDASDLKLNKLYDWCRTAIQNRERETTKLSKEETEKLKKNSTASDVLTAKIGSASEINNLFAALAKAAGFDVRLVACNDRMAAPFNKNITEPNSMFPDRAIAVQVGSVWRFFNPGASYLSAGMLPLKNSDTTLLISDPQGLELPALVAGEPAEANTFIRKGSFTLTTDGKLTGDITETYTGLLAATMKDNLDALSPAKRAAVLTKQITKALPQALLTDFTVENADSPTGQLKIAYHLEIPNYAVKTGTCLSFQPAVFKKNKPAFFTSSERKTPIVFPCRLTQKDELNFIVPEDYMLAEDVTPQGMDAAGLGEYNAAINANSVTHEVVYRREQTVTAVNFKSKVYPQIKPVFDHIYTQDQLMLTLKRTDSTPEQDASDKALMMSVKKDGGEKPIESSEEDPTFD